jgi:AraC-like DNA-binding protein
MHEQSLNLEKILHNIVQSLQPIAILRGIHLTFIDNEKPLLTNLPMDEVLPPVLTLILRLIYIFPKGRSIELFTAQRYDEDKKAAFVCLNIKVKHITFNPNLLFKSENNRFTLQEQGENHIISIEWQTDMPIEAKLNHPNSLAEKSISERIESRIETEAVVQRFEAIGKSSFIQEKLKATKSRKETDFLTEVLRIIDNNLSNTDFNSEILERSLGMSKTQLFRKLKDLTHYSTANYIRHIRLNKAADLLETTELSIGEIAEKVGFRELTYFSSSFSEEFHVSPKEWRKMKQ